MNNDGSSHIRFSPVRAICIGSILLVIGAVWIMVQELLLDAGSLTDSSPPIGAVGLFVAMLSIVLLLQWFRRRWGLERRELLVIYCMLVTFMPLASQGLWHRFLANFVRLRTFRFYPAQVPSHMIPQGPELINNADFSSGLDQWEVIGTASAQTYRHRKTVLPSVVLSSEQDDGVCEIRQWIGRIGDDGKDRFTPGQEFVFQLLFRTEQFEEGSWFSSSLGVDLQHGREIRRAGIGVDTAVDTVDRTGLRHRYENRFKIPYGVKEGLWLRFRLTGRGRVTIARAEFFSNEPMLRLIEGSDEIGAEHKAKVPRDETARLLYRPEDRGRWLSYLLRGPIPWLAWSKPLASWSLLWIAMFGAMFALASLLFRQWSDHEKLTFPLTAFPLLLTESDKSETRYMPKILRSRALWMGTLTAFVIYVLNGLHFYNSDFPHLPLRVDLGAFLTKAPWSALTSDGSQAVADFWLHVVLWGVAVAIFMDLQLAFNLWFFFLVCKLLLLVPYHQGILETRAWPMYGPLMGNAIWQFHGVGAAIGIVGIALWLGRRHLAAILVRVFRPAISNFDDRDEPMPYRLAALLLLGSFVLLGIWGELAGAGWLFGVLGMGLMIVFAVMASRVRAECAAPGMYLVPATPFVFIMALGGMTVFGKLPMTYMVYTSGFMCAGLFLMMMPAMMESFQIAKLTGIGRKPLGWAMVIGFVVAVVSSGYVILNWGYAQGLFTMRGTITTAQGWEGWHSDWWQQWRAHNLSDYNLLMDRHELRAKVAAGLTLSDGDEKKLAEHEKMPVVRPASWIAAGSAAITIGLAVVRLKVLSFPFHPLGFALATTQLMKTFWFSIFLAWFIRLVTLRLGGVRIIRSHLQPFMVGVILGSVVAVLIWDAVGTYKIVHGYTGQIYSVW